MLEIVVLVSPAIQFGPADEARMNCLNKNVNPDFGFAKRAADFTASAIIMTRSTGTTRTNTKICQLSVVSC